MQTRFQTQIRDTRNVMFISMLSIILVLSTTTSANASEIQVENINRNTWDLQTSFDSDNTAITYFDRKFGYWNKWGLFTSIYDNFFVNDFVDTQPLTDYILKVGFCTNTVVYNVVEQYGHNLMVINRFTDGSVEIIGINDCSGEYVGHVDDMNELEQFLEDSLKEVNRIGQ